MALNLTRQGLARGKIENQDKASEAESYQDRHRFAIDIEVAELGGQ